MVLRRLRIPVWLVIIVLIATFVIGSKAGPKMPLDVQPTFRIVTPGVTDVITQDLTPEIAQTLHMSRAEGVLVSDVESLLRPGDVILSVNGRAVRCQRELDAELAKVDFGQTFGLDVYRAGRVQTVTIQRAREGPLPPRVLERTSEIRGISVASLSTENGVMVVEVRIGTPASAMGLKRGDIILDVDGHPVHSADEFVEFMRQLNNQPATFNVQHRSGWIDVFVIAA